MEVLLPVFDSESWSRESFEDEVACAVLAQYESKIRKNRSAFPDDRMNEATKNMLFKRDCPYIPSGGRYFLLETSGPQILDKNQSLPDSGCFSLGRPKQAMKERNSDSYEVFFFFKKSSNLPRHWKPTTTGTDYIFWMVNALNRGGILGERFVVTVDSNGRISMASRSGLDCNNSLVIKEARERELAAYFSLCAHQDKNHSWTITARDGCAQVCLGCGIEEIKSLLYARTLPLTATGKKRPILHLVSAHKRRLASGIEIDISEYLRGIKTVEIDGTQFTVNPAAKLIKQ